MRMPDEQMPCGCIVREWDVVRCAQHDAEQKALWLRETEMRKEALAQHYRRKQEAHEQLRREWAAERARTATKPSFVEFCRQKGHE